MEVIPGASVCPDVGMDDRIRMEVAFRRPWHVGRVHGDIQVPASAGGGPGT